MIYLVLLLWVIFGVKWKLNENATLRVLFLKTSGLWVLIFETFDYIEKMEELSVLYFYHDKFWFVIKKSEEFVEKFLCITATQFHSSRTYSNSFAYTICKLAIILLLPFETLLTFSLRSDDFFTCTVWWKWFWRRMTDLLRQSKTLATTGCLYHARSSWLGPSSAFLSEIFYFWMKSNGDFIWAAPWNWLCWRLITYFCHFSNSFIYAMPEASTKLKGTLFCAFVTKILTLNLYSI